MKRLMVAAGVGVAALFLAGCPFGTAYSGPDACTLLTAPLARGAIGSQARQVASEKLSEFDTKCEYRNGLNDVSVEAGTWGWMGRTVHGSPPIAGLGDEAYMGPFGVVARKGDKGITVQISLSEKLGTPVSVTQAHEDRLKKQLAAQLLAKL